MTYIVTIDVNRIKGFLCKEYDFILSTLGEAQIRDQALQFTTPQEAETFITKHAVPYIQMLGMKVVTLDEFLISIIIDS